MRKLILVYDDHVKPNLFIHSTVGEKRFGEVILKRKSLRTRLLETIRPEIVRQLPLYELSALYQRDSFLRKLEQVGEEVGVIHIFSYAIPSQDGEFNGILEKARYARGNYLWSQNRKPMLFFVESIRDYLQLIRKHLEELDSRELYTEGELNWEEIPCEFFLDISEYANFIQYISGGFDARYFNSVTSNQFTVVKRSDQREKIMAEYQYYRLLPDEMKPWFVMPYNLVLCEDGGASYEMERYHIPDLAIRWVHGAVSMEEFRQLLERVFCFLSRRRERTVSLEEAQGVREELYWRKLLSRMEQLQAHPQGEALLRLLQSGTGYNCFDQLITRYERLYRYAQTRRGGDVRQVIGHGDLCFSNMLYNKETDLLKLIDPKGAQREEDLWSDPYYDLAKLSHSICGRYDFFNNALFQVVLGEELNFQLEINFDNQEYCALFFAACEQCGFDPRVVRIYEISLFLSMLPLHMDKPQKVFGFLLNADSIMNEVERWINN